MKMSTEWWGIILTPETEKDSEVLAYLKENTTLVDAWDIYETGEMELITDDEPYGLEIHR